MTQKRFPASIIVIGIIVLVLNVIVIGSAISGVNSHWSGFAIDGQGLLYIAGTGKIDVFSEGEKIGEIKAPTSRGFHFTIENGDTILLSTGVESFKLDLAGNLLEGTEADTELDAKIARQSKSFTTSDGLKYLMSPHLGRMRIIRLQSGKETVIYQMPMSVYILRILFALSVIGLGYCLFVGFRWKNGKGMRKGVYK